MATIAEALDLGRKYYQAGDLKQAEQVFRRVVQADPQLAEGWFLLATTCHDQDKTGEAITCYQQAVQLKKDHAATYYQLGNALFAQKRFAEAAASYQQAISLQPNHAEAHNNRGVALAEQGQLEEAIPHYQEARRIKPEYAEAHFNLGNAFKDLGRFEEAIASYEEALRLKPDNVGMYVNLGGALSSQGRLTDAVAIYRKALQLRPDQADIYNSLGLAQALQGQNAEAMANYTQALRIMPELIQAHYNRALAWLLGGNFELGWVEYEWRWLLPELPRRSLPPPLWDGSALGGRTILLHAEQGLGDTLHFVRYAPLVRERGGRVVVACKPGLLPLLATCPGIDQLAGLDTVLPPFDVHAPLMSLPGIFQTTLSTIPADVPYVFADAPRVQHWRRELGNVRALKVGIAWQGSPGYRWDRFRSIPLEHFVPLGRIPGVRLYSLQKGPGTDQLQKVGDQLSVTDLGSRLDESGGAFMDTAAVIMNLDLIITSDSAIAHLAGALGVPVWIVLPFAPEWRWLLARQDSPWYPTARLYRQSRWGDWAEVFERVAGAVEELMANQGVKRL